MPRTIEKTDIVVIALKAAAKSFSRVQSNKQAICERGWNPLNRELLLSPPILQTKITYDNDSDSISEIDLDNSEVGETVGNVDGLEVGETVGNVNGSEVSETVGNVSGSELGNTVVNVDGSEVGNTVGNLHRSNNSAAVGTQNASDNGTTVGTSNGSNTGIRVPLKLNTSDGYVLKVLAEIYQHEFDMTHIKEQVRKNQEEGRRLIDLIKKGKRLTSGVAFANNQVNLATDEMFQIVKGQKEANDDLAKQRIINLMKKYYKAEQEFSLVKEKYGSRLDNNLQELNQTELTTLAKQFLRKNEQVLKEKNELISCYQNVKTRGSKLLIEYLIDNGTTCEEFAKQKPYLTGQELIQEELQEYKRKEEERREKQREKEARAQEKEQERLEREQEKQ